MPILNNWFDPEIHGSRYIDFSDPDMVAVLVVVDENDKPVRAIGARKTVEMIQVGDPNWRHPAVRFMAFKMLHLAMMEILVGLGYRSANCWLADKLVKAYGRRLSALGWFGVAWKSFRYEVD